MPTFDQDNDDMHNFKSTAGFHFSGVGLDKLGASEYCAAGIACDKSSSVSGFAKEIDGCLKETVKGLVKSPRADNLLLRVTTFNHRIEEFHGFKPLMDCAPDSYDGLVQPGGSTSLYDASVDMIGSLGAFGAHLLANDYTAVNGIAVIITDGEDIGSTQTVMSVKKAILDARKSESLESLMTILIGINVQDTRISDFLKMFKAEAAIDQYIEAKDASAKTFAKVAGFISKSVSSQSQALGTKAASQPITF